ncbi:phospholipid scramblase 2-like [Tetranychus urticae]|uniref:Phospholipid scramblase n=1 Tax=Tetranychus urticae TaxID=32264 RepID=T1K9Q9_TETUR|nr:phospholipid scramblase 2-like [Tetranychus urticae]
MLTPNSIQEPPGYLVDPPIENPANRLVQPQPATHLVQPFHPDLYYGAKLPLTNPDGWQPGRPVPFSPPGLENLIQIDKILVKQRVDFSGNNYHIKNRMGRQIYSAIEDTTFFTRCCCGPMRPFNMKITDDEEREVINLYRPLACKHCCFPGCLQSMQVTASGVACGYIEQTWSLWQPRFNVCDASGETVLRIKGPSCTFSLGPFDLFSCCRDVKFKVLTRDGKHEIGCITRQRSALTEEILPTINHFSISFPMDLDVKIKAVLLGACFLIDFMYFEIAYYSCGKTMRII